MGVGEEKEGQISVLCRFDRVVLATGGCLPLVWPCKCTYFRDSSLPHQKVIYTCACDLCVCIDCASRLGRRGEGRKERRC